MTHHTFITYCEDEYFHVVFARNKAEALKMIDQRGMNEHFLGPCPKNWNPEKHLDERQLSDKQMYEHLPKLLHQTVYAIRIAASQQGAGSLHLVKENGALHDLIHILNGAYDKKCDLSSVRNKLTELFDSIPGFRIPKEDNLI